MTLPMPPRRPDLGRLGPGADRLLSSRNILGVNSRHFAQNRHFDRLHGGRFSDAKKPVVLFTACPHDLPVRDAYLPDEVVEWAGSPTSVRVDGRSVPVLGLDLETPSPMLIVEKRNRAPYGHGDVLMYRELYAHGFYEHGASGPFFAPNSRGNTELRLCYMIGEFWIFLAYLKSLYARVGMDRPFTVLASIRNSGNLVLGNYGDEVFHPSWDMHKKWSFSPPDPATAHFHIQWRRAFDSAGGMTNLGIAQAAREVAEHVCGAYGAGAPRCYDGEGRFSWRLWDHTRRQLVERNQR